MNFDTIFEVLIPVPAFISTKRVNMLFNGAWQERASGRVKHEGFR